MKHGRSQRTLFTYTIQIFKKTLPVSTGPLSAIQPFSHSHLTSPDHWATLADLQLSARENFRGNFGLRGIFAILYLQCHYDLKPNQTNLTKCYSYHLMNRVSSFQLMYKIVFFQSLTLL